MPRKKPGTALFDLLSDDAGHTSDTLKVPQWWSGRGRAGGGAALELPPRVERSSSDGTSSPQVAAPDRATPFIEIEGGRIRVSFTSVTAAAAVFLALTAVLAAFELGGRFGFRDGVEAGRASYAAEAMNEIEAARQQPPATYLIGDLLNEAESAPAPATGAVGEAGTVPGRIDWIRDYTYIVAQEFSADRLEDAESAHRFLAEHGIATALVRRPRGTTQLITTKGFDHEDPAQKRLAEQLLEKEHRIGAQYYADGGGYRLKGYFKTLKGDSW